MYLLCFLLFMLIPLCLSNTKRNVKSDFDNRVLLNLPKFGEAGYEKKIKAYLQDRIGLRDQIVTVYQLLNSFVTGELTHPLYTYGQDGYMFAKMHNNIPYGNYHKTFAEAVLKMKDYCESRGAKFYFVFDPEKISVYRRYLPAGVNYNDEWVDKLLAYMKERGVNCINNRDLLMKRSFEEQVFNRQYDAGHWNDLGCFYGTNHLWNVLHKDFPNVTEYSKEDFDVSTKTGKYLAASKYPVNEIVPFFSIREKWKDLTKQYSEVKRHKSYRFFQYYVNTSSAAKSYPRMLVFHGSYYNSRPYFFVGRAKEYIGVHDYQNVLNLDYYFNIFQPEAVVFEVAEYTFRDNYFDSGKMAGLDFNPGLVKGNDNINEAIETAKNHAEKFIADSKSGLCLIQHDGFDTVYLGNNLSAARYVYLFADNMIFDITKDEYGIYSASIPHGTVGNKATLYYVDNAGKAYYSDIGVQHALSFITGPVCFSYTDGAKFKAGDARYEFTTGLKDNIFNGVDLQLLDTVTGKHLGSICSIRKTGSFRGGFIHKNETGWYTIRLKGNTNKRDEALDVLAYLLKGKKYYYSFDVNELSKKRIVIKNYEFFGTSSRQVLSYITGPDCFAYSSGAIYNAGDEQYEFTTELKNNSFNAVNLQLLDTATGKYLGPIRSVASIGKFFGGFIHKNETGWYTIRLKGNTKMRDESIDVLIYLEKEKKYCYSFDVNELSKSRIVIKNFEFLGTGPFSVNKNEMAQRLKKWKERKNLN